MDDSQFRRLQYYIAGAMTLFAFIVYVQTVAPTVSYWDCGEFIATSYILGIPHPPGTPMFVELGRLFCLLPISSDVGARVNAITVVFSALVIGLAYLMASRLIRLGLQKFDQPLARWQAIVALAGGVSGALFLAFCDTYWNNANEAEVYGSAMFMMMLMIWFALLWAERRNTPRADRFLVAIAYVALLSEAFHPTTLLAMPAIFLFVIAVDRRLRSDWRFWLTGLLLFTVGVADLTTILICIGGWLAISTIMAIRHRAQAGWGLIAAIMVAGAMGYSSQVYLPIRATGNPDINENNPRTFESFQGFLGRKQYGQTNMVVRALDRRGKWINQFGDHANMGFYRYFKVQYGFEGWLMIPVMLVGFYGGFWLVRRAPPSGILLLSLFFLGSVALILYMNFADGTQYYRLNPDAYMEVRNRDYFFTPGYMMFGMMIGVGLSAIAGRIAERKASNQRLAVAIAIIAALLPLRTLQASWRGADRSGNHTPYDYAWNLLQSCAPNAILFTSGDNDTFPLWALQEAYGVRKDISIVNLSLANTDWYVWQMKHEWGLPVTFSDDQILWTVPDMSTGGELKRPKEPYTDPVSGTRHYLFPTRDGDQYVPVNEMIVEHVILNNKWKRPIYFSSGPGDKSRLSLDGHCRIIGQAFQVVPEDAKMEWDYEASARLMDSVFMYRSYDDPKIGLDDNAVGLSIAFPERMMGLGEYYRRQGDTARWDYWLKKACKTFPFYNRTYEQYAAELRARGDSAGAQRVMEEGIQKITAYAREMPETRLYWYFLGKMYESAGQDASAEKYLAYTFWQNPNDGMSYQDYVSFLTTRGKAGEAARAAAKWLEYYPNDQRARSLVTAGRVSGG